MNHCRASSDDQAYLAAFEAAQLHPESFHHREHLRVAYTMLCESAVLPAHYRMKKGLLQLLTRHHLGTEKYHETKTWAWMCLMNCAMETAGDINDFAEILPVAPYLMNTSALNRHYSNARLESCLGQRYRLEPDLLPFHTDIL